MVLNLYNKQIWFANYFILIMAGAWYFFSSKDIVGVKKTETGKEYSAAGIESILVKNQTGNVEIQQCNQNRIKIETKVRKNFGEATKGKASYKVHKKGKEFDLSAASGKGPSYEFKISIPKSLKNVDVRVVEGNVLGHFNHLKPSSSNILMIDMGQVFARIPKDSKIKLTGDAILDSVQKGSEGPRFTMFVKDIPWSIPRVMGGVSKSQKGNEVFSVAQMNNALNRVIDLFLTVHSYVKSNPSQYEKVFSEAKQLISKPMSVEEFYFIIVNIFVATKDGHTHMDDPIQTIVDLPSYV